MVCFSLRVVPRSPAIHAQDPLSAFETTGRKPKGVTVTLLNLKRPSAWDEVSDWVNRHGSIANADVVRIAKIDKLKASKLLGIWREQGFLVALPGRGKRNMAYTKPAQGGEAPDLLSGPGENNRVSGD